VRIGSDEARSMYSVGTTEPFDQRRNHFSVGISLKRNSSTTFYVKALAVLIEEIGAVRESRRSGPATTVTLRLHSVRASVRHQAILPMSIRPAATNAQH
jgi:hypothetical protein